MLIHEAQTKEVKWVSPAFFLLCIFVSELKYVSTYTICEDIANVYSMSLVKSRYSISIASVSMCVAICNIHELTGGKFLPFISKMPLASVLSFFSCSYYSSVL